MELAFFLDYWIDLILRMDGWNGINGIDRWMGWDGMDGMVGSKS